jgi:hypothetical protein
MQRKVKIGLFIVTGGLVTVAAVIAGIVIAIPRAPSDMCNGDACHTLAVSATRDLAREWNVQSLKAYFSDAAWNALDKNHAQSSVQATKALGPLKSISGTILDVDTHRQDWFWGRFIRFHATRTFLADFENGRAKVGIAMAGDGQNMKIYLMNVRPLNRPATDATTLGRADDYSWSGIATW